MLFFKAVFSSQQFETIRNPLLESAAQVMSRVHFPDIIPKATIAKDVPMQDTPLFSLVPQSHRHAFHGRKYPLGVTGKKRDGAD